MSLDGIQKRLVPESPFGISILGALFLQCFSCVNRLCVCTYTAINLPYLRFLKFSKCVGKYSKLKSPLTDKNTI